MLVPMLGAAGLCVYLGIDADGLVNLCRAAAEMLLTTGLGTGGVS